VRRGLSLADLGELLELRLVAVLATHRNDGGVLLSPVWHEWRDGGFDVVTGRDDVKAVHLRRDPRATILVYEHTPPYRGVELRAQAVLTESGAQEAARRLAVRYLGPEEGEAYVAGGVDDLLIRLEPGEVRAWDFADEYDALAPIAHEYVLRSSPEHAFAAYTERIGEWWDPRYTANSESLCAVTIEPRVGGRVYATHEDLGEHEWGTVTAWEPGRRLAHTFTLAQDPAHPSEVAVEFAPREGAGCTVRLAHGGWTNANVAAREKFGDWPVMLDRFAALADSDG
jgi:PPOX class probable F420-dependent enzyme